MASTEILEWVKAIGALICSWQVVAVFTLFIFRKPLLELFKQFSGPNVIKAKVGPVEIERELGKLAETGKQAVENINQLNQLMAESRLLELEITEGNFGAVFTKEQRQRMQNHIDKLRKLTEPDEQK